MKKIYTILLVLLLYVNCSYDKDSNTENYGPACNKDNLNKYVDNENVDSVGKKEKLTAKILPNSNNLEMDSYSKDVQSRIMKSMKKSYFDYKAVEIMDKARSLNPDIPLIRLLFMINRDGEIVDWKIICTNVPKYITTGYIKPIITIKYKKYTLSLEGNKKLFGYNIY